MATTILDATLLALLATATVTDLRARVVPDPAVLGATAVGLPLLLASDPGDLPGRLAAALGAGCFLLVPALIRPGAMGLGDVKLAAVLGLYLGAAVVAALLIALTAGAIAGLALIIRHGRAARRRTIPFAPFIALGALCAMLGGA